MKKTIVTCDDCDKEITSKDYYDGDKYHICHNCIFDRVRKSISINPPGYDKCSACKGLGYIKEWTGIGSDYDTSKCQMCHGTKRIKKS